MAPVRRLYDSPLSQLVAFEVVIAVAHSNLLHHFKELIVMGMRNVAIHLRT